MSRTRNSRRKRRYRDDDRFREELSREDSRRQDDRPQRPSRGSMFGGLAIGCLLLLAVMALGRNPQGKNGIVPKLSGSPEDILLNLADRYQNIRTYEDRTLMNLRPPKQSRWVVERADLMLRFVRPNQIRLQVSRGTSQMLLTSDGTKLHTQLRDENTRNFDHQIVERSAPKNLTIGTLFAATEIAELDQPDQLISALMSLPCPLVVSQIALLTDPAFMPQLIESASQVQQLEDANLASRKCVRVRLVSPNGPFTFWIDQAEGLLRKIEYPPPISRDAAMADSSTAEQSASRAEMAAAIVTADFENVKINSNFPPGNFRQTPDEQARLVQHFIVPPLNESAGILGKRVSGYSFTDLKGGSFSSDQLQGAPHLLVWFNNSGPSHAAVQKLISTYDRATRPTGKVQFVAVCTEPTTVMSHAQVHRLQEQWKIPFPVVRDLEAHGRDIFGISQAPTMVVVDADGVVQLFEVGGSSNLDQELPVVFEKILAGEPLAEQYLDFVQQRNRAYEQLLAAASVVAPAASETVAPTKTSGPTSPNRLQLQPLWNSDPLQEPGNLTVDNESRVPILLVNDGWHRVHEFNFDGMRLDTHDLSDEVTASDLRCWFDGPKMFATIAERSRRVSVFDNRWLPLFDYPPGDAAGSGFQNSSVQDAIIDDLDGDDRPELYVALAGESIQCVDDRGTMIWEERSITDATSLAVSHDRSGRRFLLVAHESGGVTPISSDGTLNERINSRPFRRLFSNPRLSEDASFCGSGRGIDGRNMMIGLGKGFEETWTHETANVVSRRQTRTITWAPWVQLDDAVVDGCWLLVAPEGTIHIVSEDGNFKDNFSLGTPVHGVAAGRDAGRNLIFVSTQDRVRAFEVSAR